MTHTIDVLPESLGNEKSIWEYYNEMAAVEDNIREVEWRDLADTVLVFVCLSSLWYMVTDLVLGWSIRCLPFCVPCLSDPPAPERQHRRRYGRAHPHFTTTQQLNNPCICSHRLSNPLQRGRGEHALLPQPHVCFGRCIPRDRKSVV